MRRSRAPKPPPADVVHKNMNGKSPEKPHGASTRTSVLVSTGIVLVILGVLVALHTYDLLPIPRLSKGEVDIVIAEEEEEGVKMQAVFCVRKEQLARLRLQAAEVAAAGRAWLDMWKGVAAETAVDMIPQMVARAVVPRLVGGNPGPVELEPDVREVEPEKVPEELKDDRIGKLFAEGFFIELREFRDGSWVTTERHRFPRAEESEE